MRSSRRPIEAYYGTAHFGRWNETLNAPAAAQGTPQILSYNLINPVVAGAPWQYLWINFSDPARRAVAAELRPVSAPGMRGQRVRFGGGVQQVSLMAACSVPDTTYSFQFILFDGAGQALAARTLSYFCQRRGYPPAPPGGIARPQGS